jgi:hypothetical protein
MLRQFVFSDKFTEDAIIGIGLLKKRIAKSLSCSNESFEMMVLVSARGKLKRFSSGLYLFFTVEET